MQRISIFADAESDMPAARPAEDEHRSRDRRAQRSPPIRPSERRERVLGTADPRAQLLAAGAGYIEFAASHPALFRLMFASRRADYADADLAAAAGAAYDHLVAGVAAAHGGGAAPPADVLAAWAMAHGIADLANSGRLPLVAPDAAGEAMVAAALERALVQKNRGRSPD